MSFCCRSTLDCGFNEIVKTFSSGEILLGVNRLIDLGIGMCFLLLDVVFLLRLGRRMEAKAETLFFYSGREEHEKIFVNTNKYLGFPHFSDIAVQPFTLLSDGGSRCTKAGRE